MWKRASVFIRWLAAKQAAVLDTLHQSPRILLTLAVKIEATSGFPPLFPVWGL